MYPETTEVTPVALEGSSPSNVPFLRDAACAGDSSHDWVPDREPNTVPAAILAMCTSCPVRSECLQWALDVDAEGIWAATTTKQRRGETPDESAPIHEGPGSSSHYRRGCHCGECKDAQTARIRRQRTNRHMKDSRV